MSNSWCYNIAFPYSSKNCFASTWRQMFEPPCFGWQTKQFQPINLHFQYNRWCDGRFFFWRRTPAGIIHLDVAVLMSSVSLWLCSYQLLAGPKLLLHLYLLSSVINRSVMLQPWNANAADGIKAPDRLLLSVFASLVFVKASLLFILLVSSWVGMASEASNLIWAWTKASCR